MNFVFVSPHFPKTYFHFTEALKEQGFNVFGIADCDFNELSKPLRDSLTDYYRVSNIENYDEMVQAVKYFEDKYGCIDFIESNNEYWLEQDAKLRSHFNVTTGKNISNINMFKSKEIEKIYYSKAGVKTARYIIPTTFDEGLEFVKKVGYPVVVKPDNGVGAYKTYKINNEEELKKFYFEDFPTRKYIMEEYIDGDLISFDGISDSNANAVFYSNEVFPQTIMDVVNEGDDVYYYSNRVCPEDLKLIGERVLKAFDARYRYFHMEFFRMRVDKEGLGNKGDIIGLEVNMRAPGGYTPDLIDFAHSVNTYKIWAEVMKNDCTNEDLNREQFYCVYAARRNGKEYIFTREEILKHFENEICMHEIMPDVLADDLGNEAFVAKVKSEEEMKFFVKAVLAKK